MVNLTIIKLLIFLFPGIIGYRVYHSLCGRGEKKEWEYIINTAIFSITVYYLYDIIISIIFFMLKNVIGLESKYYTNLRMSIDGSLNSVIDNSPITINFIQIVIMLIIAIMCSYIFAFFTYRCYLYKISLRFKINKRESNYSIWQTYHDKYNEWVIVKDFKNGWYYYGCITRFNYEYQRVVELIMEDVSVYKMDDTFVRESKVVYLSLEEGTFCLDVPDHTKKKICEEGKQ